MTQKQIAITDTAFAKAVNTRLEDNHLKFQEAAERIQKEAQGRLNALGKLHTEQNQSIWKDIYEHAGIPEDERKGWEFLAEYLEQTGIAFVQEVECSCSGEALLRGLAGRG